MKLSFRELQLKAEYRSFKDNVVRDFYIPALNKAVLYKRAVGFFSSTALIEIAQGVSGIVKNGGKILLITSPRLRDKDIEAINTGYEEREKIIEKAIINSLEEPQNFFEEESLNLMANLIADGKLDIKIALTELENNIGIYHEKMGLLYDGDNNVIAFTGSLNETRTAFSLNYESIDVFCSWKYDNERVRAKEEAFNNMWKDYDPYIKIIDFPKLAKEKLQQYKKREINYEELKDDEPNCWNEKAAHYRPEVPFIPDDISLYDYQLSAIEEWVNQGCTGIFDMATGTGKTYTALGAVTRLSERCNGRLAVIIVCPFQHLVEQWVDDICRFNMNPIIGYSASKQKNWKDRLKNAIKSFNSDIKQNVCFVTTNATFSSKFVQEQLNSIESNVVLVIDEAHNFGAVNLSKNLNYKVPFRLALSATLERHGDKEGTEKLYDYFGKKCIEYPLERAIKENKLCPYYYYPVPIQFTDDELSDYVNLSKQISKYCSKNKYGEMQVSEAGKMLLIKRARIIASAQEKLIKLSELIEDYKKDRHILVYCGAASVKDPDYEEKRVNEFEIRQVDAVTNLLGNKLNMRISKFTSEEDKEERERLKEEFAEGDHIQVLVAIRCLDEGVNIPNIKTAFILASSTNPKEYIQRRGRLLRKSDVKKYAVIYDFITLPRNLEIAQNLSKEEKKYDLSLINREVSRMEDFAAIAENSSETDSLINRINNVYGLYSLGGIDNVV